MRKSRDCQHQSGRELGSDDRVNSSESLINVVNRDKPKVLKGLTKRCVDRFGNFSPFPTQASEPPANRRDLRHLAGTRAERGKSITLPKGKADRKGSR